MLVPWARIQRLIKLIMQHAFTLARTVVPAGLVKYNLQTDFRISVASCLI